MRSASPFRARLPSPAQGWVCRIRGVFPSLRERFGRWHLYRAGGSKPTKVTKPPFCAGGKDLQVPERGARHRSPCKRGPSRPNRHAGGASAEFRHRPTIKQGLQGLRFAPGSVWARGAKARSARACAGWPQRGRCEPWCVPGSQVCTPAKRKTARKENSMLARVCSRFAGWVAEIGPRAFAHRLTQQTHFYVTLHTRARARAQRQVTTTCVRCVRHAGVSAAP